ncbi:MAG TPA: hypothetical protein VEV16_06600, partial [Daejeonella sp.]|nr:hypothetical protein [Daejeonella sp.]
MLVKQSEPELLSYSSNCVIAHFVEGTYRQDVLRSCDSFIVSSYFRKLEANIRPRGLSLKYVAEGLETYRFQNKPHHVSAGKYILANEMVDAGEVWINNADTWSMCVDIDTQLIQDILQQLNQPNNLDAYTDLSRYYLTPELLLRETVAGAPLKSFLNTLISSLASGNTP